MIRHHSMPESTLTLTKGQAVMVRKARISDVRAIQQLLASYARQGKLLARSLSELYTHLRDIFVHVDAENDQVTGCCSLHIVWENLAEIRSVAVAEDYLGQGIGRQLVMAAMDEARDLGIARLFVLTYETGFFDHLGFHAVDKNSLPHKIWADCIHCPKFPECDENAMILDLFEPAEHAVDNVPWL
jgi:amino-acid N-acetyltransferase